MANNDAGDPLRPQQLLRTMLAVLPPSAVGPGRRDGGGDDSNTDEADAVSGSSSSSSSSMAADTASQTSTVVADVAELATACEALALLAHACMVQLGFRLTGLREDDAPLATTFAGEDAATTAASGGGDTAAAADQAAAPAGGQQTPAPQPSRLPYHWNATPSSLSFVYSHAQSALRFVVRVDRMGATAEIRGLSLAGGSGNSGDGERIVRIAFPVADYVATALLPWRCAADDEEAGGASLRPVFVDDAHLARLAQRFQAEIVQPLLPSLQQAGYREGADAGVRNSTGSRLQEPLRQPRQPPPRMPYNPYQPGLGDDPLAAGRQPRGDFPPPGFDDEYDINRPIRGFYGGGLRGGPSGGGFGGIGGDDLHPPGLGPHDPLRPSFAGGGGGGGLGGFGGMHPTFDDPLFQGPRGGGGGGIRGSGSNGLDPQIPPGARYDDPTGPNGDELGGGGGLWGYPHGGGGGGGFGFGGGRGFGSGNGGFGGFGGGGIS